MTNAERRQITVLFCDLVGSTALSRDLDPEDLNELLREYRDRCAAEYERHGGHLLRVLGDGLLVVFGYPTAQEDAPVRAIRAALSITLAMRRATTDAGRTLAVRIGIATGVVVIDGDDVVGETPNLAARIQSLGDSNQVLIAPLTRELAGTRFQYTSLGAQRLRGFGSVETHRVDREFDHKTRFDSRRTTSLSTFVGRDGEVREIRRLQDRTIDHGLHTVLIEGEAGMGKSRLLLELRQSLVRSTQDWAEWRCESHQSQSPFYCLGDYFDRNADAAGAISHTEKRDYLIRLFENFDIDSTRAASTLAPMLGIAPADEDLRLSPEVLRRRILDTSASWLRGVASRGPIVMVVEDIHWADPSSLELVQHLRTECDREPILLILTTRPGSTFDLGDTEKLVHFKLDPLGPGPIESIVEEVLGEEANEAIVEALIGRSDGTPLFAEELARTSLSNDSPDVRAPASVHDSLLARLDRIDDARGLVQTASTIGRVFSLDLLSLITGIDEARLRRQLVAVVEEGLVEWDDHASTRIRFRHALFLEVTYESMLRSRRREVHRSIAEALEAHFPDRIVSHPEDLARHYEAAEIFGNAVHHYRRAGQQAYRRSAHHEAVAHFTAGLSLIPRARELEEPAEVELPIQISLVQALLPARGYGGEGVLAAAERSLELCDGGTDRPELFQALVALFLVYQTRGDTAKAKDFAHELSRVAQRQGDPFRLQWSHLLCGMPAHYQGHWAEARDEFAEAVRLYDIYPKVPRGFVSEQDLGVTARCMGAEALWALGETEASLALDQEALDFARRRDSPNNLAHAEVFSATLAHGMGENEACLRAAERALETARKFRFPMWAGNAQVYRGWALAESGRVDEGRKAFRLGLDSLATTGARLTGPRILGLSAQISLRAGEWEDAKRSIDGATRIAKTHGLYFWDSELARISGRTHLAKQDRLAARRDFERAAEIACEQGARALDLRANLDLAKALVEDGDRDEAQSRLAAAIARLPTEYPSKDLIEAQATLDMI